MAEEKPTNKKEEKALSILDQIKQEREAVEKANEEAKTLIAELREAKALDVLSGKVEQPKQEEKKEMTPEEYSKSVLTGVIPEEKK